MENEREKELEGRRRQLLAELQLVEEELVRIRKNQSSSVMGEMQKLTKALPSRRNDDQPRPPDNQEPKILKIPKAPCPSRNLGSNMSTQDSSSVQPVSNDDRSLTQDNQEPGILKYPMAQHDSGNLGHSMSTKVSSLIQQISDQPNPFRTFKKLSGGQDLGREFEQTMCGYYALRLTISEDVVDFEMTSNNIEAGKFDDIGLTVSFSNGINKKFLFQLKHKERKNINLSDLKSEGKNNDFGLRKYVESISKNQFSEDAVCILFTNCATNIRGSVQIVDGVVEQCATVECGDFLVNTEDGHQNVIFEVKAQNLKQKFYLFTSQLNVEKTEEKVNGLLKSLLECNIHGAFTSFMKNWWLGRFVLTKHDTIAKITELVLSPYLKILNDRKCNEKTEILTETIMNYPVTLVQECGEDTIENIWRIESSWINDEFTKTKRKYGLKENEKNTVLWYLGKIPLIVKVDDSNQGTIQCVMDLLGKGVGHKRVILSGQMPKRDFKLDTLTNLSDIIKNCKDLEIMETFKVSLQGRGCITLKNFIRSDEDVAKLIGIRELLEMSQEESLLIGNRKKLPSDSYVPRSICPIFVKIEDILNFYRSSHEELLIINCDSKFSDKISENGDVKTLELSQWKGDLIKETDNLILLSTGTKCTIPQFERVCEKSEKLNVYLLQVFDESDCILILRKGREFRFEYTDESKTVRDTDILRHYNTPLQAFCASPGMGKSTLMVELYNTCPSDCLAVYVSLINHNSFLATNPTPEEILSRFLQTDGTEEDLFDRLKQDFCQKHRLFLFLDGLDEVNSQHIGRILDFIKVASSGGANVWVSSRDSLREVICQKLNMVPVDIKELDKDEQERYIYSKLRLKYTDEQIEKITNAVFNSTDLNNSQNLLGIPLQLYIITEVFLHDRTVYEDVEKKNFFVLTNMYRIFFKGKIKFACSKLFVKDQEPQLGHLDYVLQAYELPALKTCLNEEEFARLDLDTYGKQIKEFSDELRAEGDKYGIVERITKDSEIIFYHQTYAEYFACVWFRKNPNKMLELRDGLFSKRYENLRRMFDVLLAENNPLHLCVIYKDVEELKNHLGEVDSEDEGGRTAFHLASSYGKKYAPFLLSDYKYFPRFKRRYFNSQDVYINRFQRQKREESCYVKIIALLLTKCKVFQKRDTLFNFDCIRYAIQAECLYPIETLLRRELVGIEEVEGPLFENYDTMTLAYHCAQFGYPNLLSVSIKNHPGCVSEEDLLEIAIKGCDGDLYSPPRPGNIEAVKLLMGKGVHLDEVPPNMLTVACINKCFDVLAILVDEGLKCDKKGPMLHLLVENCPEVYHREIVSAIKRFNIDVNETNIWGTTALHKAAESADLKIVEALLENGADIHSWDIHRRTVLDYAGLRRNEVLKLL